MAVGTTIDVVMPQMGESVTEGTVLTWHKGEGDAVQADETVGEISTDKVDAELPAPAAGTLAEILAQQGETVTVGQVIGRIAAGETVAAAAPAAEPAGPAPAEPEAPAAPAPP